MPGVTKLLLGTGASVVSTWSVSGRRSLMWQDTAGTIPADDAGESVARANDPNAGGFNLLQATAGACPTFQRPICMNFGALRFTGGTPVDWMATATGPLSASVTALTVGIAFRMQTLLGGTPQQYFFGVSRDRTYNMDDNVVAFVERVAGVWSYRVQISNAAGTSVLFSSQADGGGIAVDTDPHTLIFTCVFGVSISVYLDGVLLGSKSLSTVSGPLDLSNVIETGMIASGTVGSQPEHDLYEITVVPQRVPAASLTALDAYYKAQWNIYPTTTLLDFQSQYGAAGFMHGVTLKVGSRLWLYYYDSSDDGATDAKLYSRYSDDVGANWTAAVLLRQNASNGINIYYTPVLLSNGNVLIVYYLYPQSTNRSVAMVSTDSGSNFTDTVISDPSGYQGLVIDTAIVELSDGTLITAGTALNTTSNAYDSLMMQSTNGGTVWTIRGVIAAGDASNDYAEPALWNVSGSNWKAIVRDFHAGVNEAFTYTSSNNGTTWGSRTAFSAGTNYVELTATRLIDNVLLVDCNNRTSAISSFFRSTDNGVTFNAVRNWEPSVLSSDGPGVIEWSSGRMILCRSYGGPTPGGQYRANLKVQSMGEAWF